MGKTLKEIAQELKDSNKKVQLIYAFNGTGKTRLSKDFKELIEPKGDDDIELEDKKILYYNAFTEDLFYWDNDLQNDTEPKLKIHPNAFTEWVFTEQGQEPNVIRHFQHYTEEKLTPHFNERYTFKNDDDKDITVPAFTEVTFSYERGNDDGSDKIKISKGEESCFIWSIFYSLLKQVVEVLNIGDPAERETDKFNNLKYVFIDDPVSSLDENHLIELAVNLAQLIKSSDSELKFLITTHNPLFYNVLHNELRSGTKYFLERNDMDEYDLIFQNNDSPFSYHLFLKKDIENAIASGQLKKYHFNFLRNILEKTSTFLGYETWGELLPQTVDGRANPYESRIINIASHSQHAAEEIVELNDADKRVLIHLMDVIKNNYKFK